MRYCFIIGAAFFLGPWFGLAAILWTLSKMDENN